VIDPEAGGEQWDVLRIGSMRSPGVVRLGGPGLVIGWDVQNATGLAGAVTRRINEPLKEFDAEFELSNELDDLNVSDFDTWDPFEAMLRASVSNRQKPYALDVYHPDLARVGITAATLKSIGMLVPNGKGGGTIKVQFIEFRPPKPNKPIASTKTAGDKKIDEATAEIDKLQNEWKSLDGAPPKATPLGASL